MVPVQLKALFYSSHSKEIVKLSNEGKVEERPYVYYQVVVGGVLLAFRGRDTESEPVSEEEDAFVELPNSTPVLTAEKARERDRGRHILTFWFNLTSGNGQQYKVRSKHKKLT